jgi:F0F1-type ATP synthase assembly protein I
VLNSVAAGRRLVLRATAFQLGAVLLVAMAFLLWGKSQALAAAVGGLAMVAGGWFAARLAFGAGVTGAGTAMVRLLAGMVIKWITVVVVLLLGIGVWKLPPLALLAGTLTGMAAQALAMARLR